MSEEDTRGGRRQSDMILAPNEYAFISDETKGEVNVFVGPNKTSLAGTDRCVAFDLKTKRFKPASLEQGTQTFQTAPEGWYVILKNPAEGDKHPTSSGKLSTPPLRVGKKVNIAGPASFALWPGQMAKVIQGHNLRSNEYLLVRVYDEEAARANWSKAVIKTQSGDDAVGASQVSTSKRSSLDIPSSDDLTMGKLFVIRGTDVSFYIPSTGIEVVPEKVNGEERYVREAVTLERLEYCLLLDQNGSKRYVHGPDVVFPRPTEKFVEAPIKSNPEKAKAKKFRAQELTPASGIHIRVIADYVEDDGTQRKAGDELFITGNEQTIYFPREEHATIKYGEQDIHYGIAIPEGEARYVLDRQSGVISIVRGPKIFLPDPRTQVIAQRALDPKLCELMYPGNVEALEVNAARLGMDGADIGAAAGSMYYGGLESSDAATAAVATADTTRRIMIKGASKTLPGDTFDRKKGYTPPRSVVLNTKYDGAVSISPWTGYAVLLVRKSGERRVVRGPGTYLLEYDESPQVLSLSRGKPKTTDDLLQTVYLLTTANKVADIVEVETQDFCKLSVKLSYRVNFEGDPNQWFNVDNYVKFLCDHMRSKVRSAVQKLGIEEFYGRSTEILRDIILGSPAEDGTGRPGTSFKENGMRIYDVEVLSLQMQNPEVEKLLVNAQREAIQNTLLLAGARRKLSYTQETEEISRAMEDAKAETVKASFQRQEEQTKQRMALDMASLEASSKVTMERLAQEFEAEKKRLENEVEAERVRREATVIQMKVQEETEQARLAVLQAEQALELKKLEAQTAALERKGAAISPDLIAALSSYGEKAMVEKVAEAMAPLSILGGGSVVDVMKKLLEGTTLAQQLEPAVKATKSR